MTLSDLASIGSFISGVGVLVSLVYLSLQIRQSTKHTRASIRQGRVARIVDSNFRRADPVLAAIMVKGSNGDQPLDELEFFQYMSVQQARFVNAEETFLQHENGMLDDDSFHTFLLTQQGFMTAPGNRAIWKLVSAQYDRKFAAFMDGVVRDAVAQNGKSPFARWTVALAEEKKPTT